MIALRGKPPRWFPRGAGPRQRVGNLRHATYCSEGRMRIAAWMKHPVVTVKPHDSAQHAREVMEKHRINQLPVVIDDRLVGIVTDRDLRDASPSVFESAPLFRRQRTQ